MKLLAQGTDINGLGSFEHLIPEGAQVRFVARLSEPLYDDELDGIWDEIESHGVVVLDVRQKGTKLIVDAEKHIGPLLFIGLAVAGLVAIPIMVFSWRLFMMDPKDIFRSIVLPIAVVSTIGIVAIAYIARPRKAKLVEAGKTVGRGAAAVAPYARKAVMKV